MLELGIVAEVERSELTRSAHEVLEFGVVGQVEFGERVGVALDICHFGIVCRKVQGCKLVAGAPDASKELVVREIPVLDFVVLAIDSA